MRNIYVDVEKTLGDDLRFVSYSKWLDYKTKKQRGTRVQVVSIKNNFDKFNVNIPEKEIYGIDDFVVGDKVIFEDLEGEVFVFDGKMQPSFKASAVFKKD